MLIAPGLLDGILSQNAIFIVGIGAAIKTDGSYPDAAKSVEIPTGDVGDLLVGFMDCGPGGVWNPSEGATWTDRVAASGGGMGVFDRVATNDSGDDFTVPAAVTATNLYNVRHAQVIRLRAGNSNTVAYFQQGTVDVTTARTAFEMLAMTAGTETNDTFVIGAYIIGGVDTPSGQGTSMTTLTTVTNISDHTIGGTAAPSVSPWYFFSGWGYRFDAVSAAAAAETITYSPNVAANGFTEQVSVYLRYRAI